MQSTLTLLREADPRRYGALPADVWRGTIKRLALSQTAFVRRAHEGAGPPRFKSEARFRTFSFLAMNGITLDLLDGRDKAVAIRAANFSCLSTREPRVRDDEDADQDEDDMRPVLRTKNAKGRNADKDRSSPRRSRHSVATLRFQGMPGRLKVAMHRPLPEGVIVKDATFTLKGERWVVTFKVEAAKGVLADAWQAGFAAKQARRSPEDRIVRREEPVGADWGVTTLFALSDGTDVENPRLFRAMRDRIVDLSRALARRRRGSENRRKARKGLRACWRKLANMRLTFAHQVTADMVARYKRLALEDLNVKATTRSAKGTVENPGTDVRRVAGLNREVLDTSPATLMGFVRYKAERAGGEARFVQPHGTSMECCECHAIRPKDLGEREHRCGACGLAMPRDRCSSNVVRDRGYPVEASTTEHRQAA